MKCGAEFQGLDIPFLHPRQYCDSCVDTILQEHEQRAEAALRDSWKQDDGVRQDVRERCTFASFDAPTSTLANAAQLVQEWAEQFVVTRGKAPSVFLYSPNYGVGKTHLAVAALNYVEAMWPTDLERPLTQLARFESGPGLVARIQATYSVPRDQRDSHETEEQVYDKLINAKLLVLDDVDKQKPSDYTQRVFFHIINERHGAPVLITANSPLDGPAGLARVGWMNEATVSRLSGMTKGFCIKLEGQDYRRTHGVA